MKRNLLRLGAAAAAMVPGVALAAPSRLANTGHSSAVAASAATFGGALSPTWLVVVVCASLLPFLLLMMTSFVKVSVVLSILRSALGGAQLAPSSVITGLAMILTLFVMAPTGQRMYDAFQAPRSPAAAAGRPPTDPWGQAGLGAAMEVGDRVKEPLRDFLFKNADSRERSTFHGLALQMRTPELRSEVAERDFLVLVPAFVTSELRRAFEIGFLLFIPFLILDLVIANLLTALGMPALSPTSVSLPFKLLLFVLIDGWHLVARGLVQSYL